MHAWDPRTYLAFAAERGRPFLDLLARVHASAPQSVVDLGCGPGTLTAVLARRWPDAVVVGVDSSPEMVTAARAAQAAPEAAPGAASEAGASVRYVLGDLRDWQPDAPVDVLVTNATLQWVPGHLDLLPDLLSHVAPGGWLALQVPGNFGEPSHTVRHELEADPRFAPYLRGVEGPQAHDAEIYLERLLALGCSVDAWETTYLHVLTGPDPVFSWAVGTGARPTLQALPDALRSEFEEEFRRALRSAYPSGGHGTVLPFRRVFAVARTAPGRHPA